jgi:hypothetical protein
MKYIVGDIGCGGFGAMVARRKLIMQIAEAFNREPIFRFISDYAYEDPYVPLTTTIEDLKKKGIKEAKTFNFDNTEDEVVYFDFLRYWNTENMVKYQCWYPNDTSYLFYSGKMYGLLKYKKNFEEQMLEQINAIKEDYKIFSLKDVIGVHLRRGDKVRDNKYLSDDIVFKFIEEKFGTNIQLFIASDEEEYIYFLKEKYKQYDILFDKNEKRYGNKDLSNLDLVNRNPELKFGETVTFIKNVEILKQCKCVIGMYNAQITKIGGSMNSFINQQNNLYLLNPETNELDTLGSSPATS